MARPLNQRCQKKQCGAETALLPHQSNFLESTALAMRQAFRLLCATPSFQGKAGQFYARKNRK